MKWICKYCKHPQISSGRNRVFSYKTYDLLDEDYQSFIELTKCLNNSCGKIELTLRVEKGKVISGRATSKFVKDNTLFHSLLLPDSSAVVQPDFIPEGLRNDYYEACSIASRSPKAAATLARRCLQGMISDFCGIRKSRLIDQIKTLRNQVDQHQGPEGVTMDNVDSIDDVRHVGNVGAHMEKDVNLIIDIEPEEATLLLNLIEQLFEGWYVERKARQDRRSAIKHLAEDVKSRRTKHGDLAADGAQQSGAEVAKD